ncbi:pantothenate synthetase [Paenibacillus sp. J31TS4]|uniref:pantoate--beta-alanine ligase n=1 Tax=Paenibacillus sp. J31TS4 TaxID=2807195 RepID=UPI001B20C972|nr:pantoate--beta-alanine ligase [Paenibacillus sp. J31TS4]GIP37434.1 pantothenate synthetase [Paenibacillus sp. J31TS4]
MKAVRTIQELRHELAERRTRRSENGLAGVGFVPTMGYLHAGHASLLKKAREECGTVVLSIFVNPLQFGPNEDFDRYPRDEEKDLRLAEECGVDFVFLPSAQEMYPRPIRTTVAVSGLTERLCGASRPGHFDGVATVVSKLLNVVQPDRAYFGMKDAQQVAVVQQMTSDLNMPTEIVPCPTLRDADGLALSSRNVYLSDEERRQALSLPGTLRQAETWLAENADPSALRDRIMEGIQRSPLADIDYVEVLTYPSLLTPEEAMRQELPGDDRLLVACAVRYGKTRLIDNVLLPWNNEKKGAEVHA